MLEGILCIDKPQEHTSFDVIARMRGILHTRKLGHAGTLDPMATGVLPVFIGRATKACDLLPIQDKRYTATFRLGLTTDTQDITGTLLEERPVTCSPEEIRETVASFVGEQLQLPPMYSAVKVNGTRLYDLAREGREVERTPRPVTFYSIDILALEGAEITIDVACSKGSYIRTLCHDMGQQLGCGATLTALRRTEAAGFALSQCLTLDELKARVEAGDELPIVPVEQIFRTLPRLELSEDQTRLYRNGVKLHYYRLGLTGQEAELAVYGPEGFLGISRPDPATGELRLVKLFALL